MHLLVELAEIDVGDVSDLDVLELLAQVPLAKVACVIRRGLERTSIRLCLQERSWLGTWLLLHVLGSSVGWAGWPNGIRALSGFAFGRV